MPCLWLGDAAAVRWAEAQGLVVLPVRGAGGNRGRGHAVTDVSRFLAAWHSAVNASRVSGLPSAVGVNEYGRYLAAPAWWFAAQRGGLWKPDWRVVARTASPRLWEV